MTPDLSPRSSPTFDQMGAEKTTRILERDEFSDRRLGAGTEEVIWDGRRTPPIDDLRHALRQEQHLDFGESAAIRGEIPPTSFSEVFSNQERRPIGVIRPNFTVGGVEQPAASRRGGATRDKLGQTKLSREVVRTGVENIQPEDSSRAGWQTKGAPIFGCQ